MGKNRAVVNPPLSFDAFQNEARNIHADHASSYNGIFYWKNEVLYPDYSSIPEETKTIFYLKQAKQNDALETIRSHHDPLAFTSNSGSIKLRVWNLSQVQSLAQDGSSTVGSHQEFEVWISSNGYSSTRESIFDELTSIGGETA